MKVNDNKINVDFQQTVSANSLCVHEKIQPFLDNTYCVRKWVWRRCWRRVGIRFLSRHLIGRISHGVTGFIWRQNDIHQSHFRFLQRRTNQVSILQSRKKCSNGDFLIVEYTVIKLLEGWIPSYFESSLYIFRKKCLSRAKITIFIFFSEGTVTNPAF